MVLCHKALARRGHDVIALAFNRDAKDELLKRLGAADVPRDARNAQTLHGFGLEKWQAHRLACRNDLM